MAGKSKCDEIWAQLRIWVLENDMFGYLITLNFNKQSGGTYNTVFGGIYSIFIKCFLVYYCWLNVSKIFTHKDDDNVTTVGLYNVTKLGDFNYEKDSGILIFQVLRK